MIKEFQKFQLPDIKAQKHLKAEVNWSDDSLINESKVIKFTCPDGTEVLVKREHLNEILFALGNQEEQQRLIPQKLTTVHWRKTVLGIKATKDIKRGQMINLPIEISFPCTNVEEIIGTTNFKKDAELARSQESFNRFK